MDADEPPALGPTGWSDSVSTCRRSEGNALRSKVVSTRQLWNSCFLRLETFSDWGAECLNQQFKPISALHLDWVLGGAKQHLDLCLQR